MKTPSWKDPFSFVDVDPLDESLLRYSDAMDKALQAAKKYSSRLARRLKSAVVEGHKAYLKKELARANKIINPEGAASTASAPADVPPTQ